jgi:hypothetical protein
MSVFAAMRHTPPEMDRPDQRDPAAGELAAEPEPPAEPETHIVQDSARRAIERFRSGVAAARDPIVDRVGQALDGVERTFNEIPGARVRRIRRLGQQPLLFLEDVHPEARLARPVQVGLRTIDVEEIAGTAVGGGAQRGGDFLPLKPFRGGNWAARWQRLRQAQENMAILPPIDVVKFADRYWVVDGHNRVALAKYTGQREIDANVVELIPPGGRRTEPILPLASYAADSRAIRTAASGHRPSDALSTAESVVGEPQGLPPDEPLDETPDEPT